MLTIVGRGSDSKRFALAAGIIVPHCVAEDRLLIFFFEIVHVAASHLCKHESSHDDAAELLGWGSGVGEGVAHNVVG